MAPMRTTEQRSMFAARMKIMWEEELVDLPIDYKCRLQMTSQKFR